MKKTEKKFWRGTETVEQTLEQMREKKGWEKKEMAHHMGVDPATLSQKLGNQWNLHWRAFRNLLPIMLELDVLTESDLHGHKAHDSHPDSSGDKAVKARTDSRKKVANVR